MASRPPPISIEGFQFLAGMAETTHCVKCKPDPPPLQLMGYETAQELDERCIKVREKWICPKCDIVHVRRYKVSEIQLEYAKH